MTTPPAQQNHSTVAQPAATFNVPQLLRAVVSVLETVAFIIGAILSGMNNGQDFHHALFAALLGFVAHGVNHNAGGSPI